MACWVVSGSNRGIGLELCRQLAGRGDDVVAVCRRASSALEALGAPVVAGIDVADPRGVERLAQALAGRRIDVLVHNAGICEDTPLEALDLASIRRQIEVNALAPLAVTRALLPGLPRGAKIALITSLMGSMGDNASGGYYGYRMSKAALNAAGVSLARDLRSRGIAVALLHPGLVATEMTGGQGVPAAQAARGLIARIDEWTPAASGAFRDADGDPLPW